jgi:hypothetical protein
VLGDSGPSSPTNYGLFYALNTTPDNVPINQPPTVTLASPPSNSNVQQGTTINVAATVQDDGAINRVEFFYNNNGTTTNIGTDTTPDADGQYHAQFTSASAGGYGVFAVAYDSDSDGTVARVELYRGFYDELIGTDFNAPYSFKVSTPTPSPFDLYAVAFDNDGNRTQSAAIRIFFQYPDTDPQGQPTISGRIRHQQSTPGNEIFLPHALVKLNLNGQFIRATQTDAAGSYIFDHLSRGDRYEVMPAEPGFTFAPPSVTFEGLVNNETWDFAASGLCPTRLRLRARTRSHGRSSSTARSISRTSTRTSPLTRRATPTSPRLPARSRPATRTSRPSSTAPRAGNSGSQPSPAPVTTRTGPTTSRLTRRATSFGRAGARLSR